MQFYWTYTGCDTSDQAAVGEASRSRQAQLEAKAELVGADQYTPVVVAVEHGAASPQWSIRAAIYAPQATASVETRSDEMIDAFDRLIGELAQQIDEQADQPPAVALRRRGREGILPVLESMHRKGASGEFTNLLTPVLGSIHNYIGRELRIRCILGEIPAGATSLQSVRNAVLSAAWDRFDDRPAQRALDAWLIGLVEETLDQLARPTTDRSLQERPSANGADSRESQKFESVEHATDADSIALAKMLAERPDVEPWNRLDIQGRQVRLDRLLQNLPRAQRHALMLQAVDGFSETEIADLQNRSPNAVAEDVAAAQREVRRMFTEQDYLEIDEKLRLEGLGRTRRSHRS